MLFEGENYIFANRAAETGKKDEVVWIFMKAVEASKSPFCYASALNQRFRRAFARFSL